MIFIRVHQTLISLNKPMMYKVVQQVYGDVGPDSVYTMPYNLVDD